MGSRFNNFYEKCEKTIETSKKIESLYQELADVEFRYGKDSNEYIMLTKIIKSISLTEFNDLKYFLSSPYVDYFEKYISLNGCDRLIEKINGDLDFSKKVISENDEFIKHKICKNIFNLIYSKTYIKVLDLYISKEKDKETKRFLIEEKYDVIQRNNFLEKWYFNYESIVCMLIESDYLSSLEVGINKDKYVNLKNNYYTSIASRFIDLVYSNELDSVDKMLYETNIMSLLLCMDNEYSFNNLCEIKDDFRQCLVSSDTKKYVNNIYTKYLKLEKKLRTKYKDEEVI